MTSHPRATLFGTPDYQTLLDQLPRRWSDQVDDAKVAVSSYSDYSTPRTVLITVEGLHLFLCHTNLS